jgi:hypothetical protein
VRLWCRRARVLPVLSAGVAMSVCHGCGTPVEQRSHGRRRKWCSDRCRKVTLYSRPCLDCGATVNLDGRVTDPNVRCVECSVAHIRAGSRQWILDSFAEWHRLFGVPPAAGDWNPSRARRMMKRPDDYFGRTLARHDSTGRRWPSTTLVANHFGTWNAALSAAGFEPLTPKQYWIGRRKLAVMA